MATINPFGFFEKSARTLTPWGKISKTEQRRQINGYQRVNPGTTESQARKALSDGRQRGRIFRTGTSANEEQYARTIVYQDRKEANRVGLENRKRNRMDKIEAAVAHGVAIFEPSTRE